MEFGEDETEILMGLRNQSVKIYDVKFRSVFQLSFIACLQKKIKFLTLKIMFMLQVTDERTRPGSIVRSADPRIRIRIKMLRIPNTGSTVMSRPVGENGLNPR
jgi:hypothetical protein